MDNAKKDTLLIWLNCLDVGPELREISELANGNHVIEILKIICNPGEDKINEDDWILTLKRFLEDFYKTSLGDVICFNALLENELETVKAITLLLCASVTFDNGQRFIDNLTKLETRVQLEVKTIIQGVLLENFLLNRNFANMFLESACHCRESSPTKGCISLQNITSVGHNDLPLLSPITQLLRSPEIVNKIKLNRKILNLQDEVDAERTLRTDIEVALKKKELVLEKNENSMKQLQKDLTNLQVKYDDVCLQLEETQSKLMRLQANHEKMKDIEVECKEMKQERDILVKEKLELEEKLEFMSVAYNSCDLRYKELKIVEGRLCELKELYSEKTSENDRLLLEKNELEVELFQIRQLYAENTKRLEDKLNETSESEGEVMTVVTEKNLEELKAKHCHLQQQYDDLKTSSEKEICALHAKVHQLDALIAEKADALAELQKTKFQELEACKEAVNVKEALIKSLQMEILRLKGMCEEKTRSATKTMLEKITHLESELKICQDELVKMLTITSKKEETIVTLQQHLELERDAASRVVSRREPSRERLEQAKCIPKVNFNCKIEINENNVGETSGLSEASSVLEVEKVRRKSVELNFFMNQSTSKFDLDESIHRLSEENALQFQRLEFNIPKHNSSAYDGLLDDASLHGITLASLQSIPSSPIVENRVYNECDEVEAAKDEISRLSMNIKALQDELTTQKMNNCQMEIFKKENENLLLSNRRLETQLHEMTKELDKAVASLRCQEEMITFMHQVKKDLSESEMKNKLALKKIMDEYRKLKEKFEESRQTIVNMRASEIENEKLLEDRASKLRDYKSLFDGLRMELVHSEDNLKREKEIVTYLSARLQEEEKRLAPHVEKVRELERTVNRFKQENRSLEAQLNLANVELKKCHQDEYRTQRHSILSHIPRSVTREISASLGNLPSNVDDVTGCNEMAFERLANARKESTQDFQQKIWGAQDATVTSSQQSILAGNLFTCEDEADFLNYSYIGDFQKGLKTEDFHGRISELQRRNVLCLPHLKTSYPVETQMHESPQYTDEELKAGNAVDDTLVNIDEHEVGLLEKQKVKPLQPSYHKPGPPTPVKCRRTMPEEPKIKTPSGIRNLFRRSNFETPKQLRLTPKKVNRENVPPEPTKTPTFRRGLAFQIGFSPKPKCQKAFPKKK